MQGWARGEMETVTSKGSAHPPGSSGAGMVLQNDPALRKEVWPFYPFINQLLGLGWAWAVVMALGEYRARL